MRKEGVKVNQIRIAKVLLKGITGMTNTTRIIFVRHAGSQYGVDDRIRPLTDDGVNYSDFYKSE